MSHFEPVRFCTLFPARSALISSILGGRSGRRPTRPTGRNLNLGTVVFDQAQGRSFPWATYTEEGFTGTLQVFRVPLEIFVAPPSTEIAPNVRASSEGYYVSISQARTMGAAALLASKQRSASAGATRQHAQPARVTGNPLQ
jgi:hypothetical protein